MEEFEEFEVANEDAVPEFVLETFRVADRALSIASKTVENEPAKALYYMRYASRIINTIAEGIENDIRAVVMEELLDDNYRASLEAVIGGAYDDGDEEIGGGQYL